MEIRRDFYLEKLIKKKHNTAFCRKKFICWETA